MRGRRPEDTASLISLGLKFWEKKTKKEESRTTHILCGQIYRNDEWGFELRCPDYWSIDEGRAGVDNLNVKFGSWKEGQLIQVNIFGDGYFMAINKNGDIGLFPDKEYQVLREAAKKIIRKIGL